jgi:hypothetical protein
MNLGKSSDDMRRASGLRLPAEVGPEALEEVKETEVLETVVEDDVTGTWRFPLKLKVIYFHETIGTIFTCSCEDFGPIVFRCFQRQTRGLFNSPNLKMCHWVAG